MNANWVVKTETQHRREIIEVCKRIYQKGFVASNDGNVSVRISDDHILATPTGVNKGDLSPDQLIKVNMKGEIVEGFLRPSSELKLHIRAYELRPDIRSVVHAHPPISTGFAVAGVALDQMAIPEVIATLGTIPLAPYATPSTEELAHTIDSFIGRCDAILLSNHGVVTVGKDVYSAYYTLERVEHSAFIIWVARSLGGERPLSRNDIEKLLEVRKRSESSSDNILAQEDDDQTQAYKIASYSDQELIELITKTVLEVVKNM